MSTKFKKTLEEKKQIEKEIQEIKNSQIANEGRGDGKEYNW